MNEKIDTDNIIEVENKKPTTKPDNADSDSDDEGGTKNEEHENIMQDIY